MIADGWRCLRMMMDIATLFISNHESCNDNLSCQDSLWRRPSINQPHQGPQQTFYHSLFVVIEILTPHHTHKRCCRHHLTRRHLFHLSYVSLFHCWHLQSRSCSLLANLCDDLLRFIVTLLPLSILSFGYSIKVKSYLLLDDAHPHVPFDVAPS